VSISESSFYVEPVKGVHDVVAEHGYKPKADDGHRMVVVDVVAVPLRFRHPAANLTCVWPTSRLRCVGSIV